MTAGQQRIRCRGDLLQGGRIIVFQVASDAGERGMRGGADVLPCGHPVVIAGALPRVMFPRPDVLPAPVLQQLSKLQDRIEPFSTTEARIMVEKELGAPLDTIFSEFSAKPIAAASLAQVWLVLLNWQ